MSNQVEDIELQPSTPMATPLPIPSPNHSSSRLATSNYNEQRDEVHNALDPRRFPEHTGLTQSTALSQTVHNPHGSMANHIDCFDLDGATDAPQSPLRQATQLVESSTVSSSPVKPHFQQLSDMFIEPSDSLDGNRADMQSLDGLIDDLESEPVDDKSEKENSSDVQDVPDDLLRTDQSTGLSDGEVAFRRRRYGSNELSEEKGNHFKKLLSFFVGPIQFVMEAAVCLSFGLQNWIDGSIICGLLLLNAGVGFVQEAKAGSIVNELKKTLTSKCMVVRGTLREAKARDLVPGDIVQLEEGFIVPADGRLITSSAHLYVDQSALTGESLAVTKTASDTVFQSSLIKRGESLMIVTATGDMTFVGRSAALVNAAALGSGHFTQIINYIGVVLLALVVLALFVVWTSSFYRSVTTLVLMRHTLAIVIIGVPVGLPAVVTTTMAVGASFLARKKAIVQKLSAIESLAGVEILCSDKTGTLTKNKLSLGEPYVAQGATSNDLMLTACLAASRKRKGLDAIDRACLKALTSYGPAKHALPKYKVVHFAPFDPVSKKVTAIVEKPGGELITCVKGAPMAVLNMVLSAGFTNEEVLQGYNDKVEEFANRGFRSLGIARKRGSGDWQLLGILPCLDPPRNDTAATIREAQELGLRIKMLTGDAVGIAKETSRQLGLGVNIYNSERLGLDGKGLLPGSKLYDFVEAADGFAEVFPQHKYNVVDILQKRGFLVAMTGDGVNDAPSLKKADTGIAVEGASDAARSAADIVFLAPGLSAIIDAIKSSRQIFHRMYAYMVYRIALSLHLLVFFGLWITIWNEVLNLTLVVFIAIFADVATLAIAYDNAPYSKSPVKWNLPKLWGIAIVLGLILAISSILCLTILLENDHTSWQPPKTGMSGALMGGTEHERVGGTWGGIVHRTGERDTILFLQIVLTENWLILITRAGGHWKSRPSWQLVGAILIVDAIATAFCHFGLFIGNRKTDLLTIVRVYIFSLGVFAIMAMVYYLLSDSVVFDNVMHGRRPRQGKEQKRSVEDFGMYRPHPPSMFLD
ncbi:MAG: hypothetical protein Q9163_002025 [Psora crenata]